MIVDLPQSEGCILGFEITGKVTLAQQQEWIEKIESTLKGCDKISVLIVLSEGASWGLDAGVEDIKWVMRHMSHIEKIAIVSSSQVWKWLVSIDSLFASMVGISEKHFDHGELAAAWDWIKGREGLK